MTSASNEDSLIARYFRPLATDPGAFALTDDAAVLKAHDGDDLVVTTDAVVEGVHFLPGDPADTIARKALRVNLSDLAAKGAVPVGFVLTLALRGDEDWLAAFARGLGEDAMLFRCPLLGGDTVATPGPLMISVTAFGRVPAGRMVRRVGAAAGDLVIVTGTIGDACLGLAVLQDRLTSDDAAARAYLVDRYRVPQPRNALANAVRDHASAAMDVSDGLAGDLAKLCAASGVSAVMRADAVPLSHVAAALVSSGVVGIDMILSGGDDYEILCTIPATRFVAFAREAETAGVAVTTIGSICAGEMAPRFVDAGGHDIALTRLSYSHF